MDHLLHVQHWAELMQLAPVFEAWVQWLVPRWGRP
jgi:acyl transferase domain-containing protein